MSPPKKSTTPKPKKQSKHYVDNKKLFAAMVDYRAKLDEAAAADKEPPRIPMYIGECIMKIATHLAYRPNFANYSYREEMISDGIETCCRYIHNFDPAKFNNPHAYFTTAIWRAFVQRIQKEKLYLYKKHAATQIAEMNQNTTTQQSHDHNDYKSDTGHGEWNQEQMLRFMEDFETTRRKRRKKIIDK